MSRIIQMYQKSWKLLLLASSCTVFYLFSYNSGYGYDALEYLVIGRSLLDGHPFYTYIPSKSWALYVVVALFLSLGWIGHGGITMLITAIYALVIISTYRVVQKLYDGSTALLSTLLVGLCCFFMELNYLEPEGLVYVFGLAGFYAAIRAVHTQRMTYWLLAGIWFGAAVAFKSVAVLYIFATILFILYWNHARTHTRVTVTCQEILTLSLGLSISFVPPILYFAWTGRLDDYLLWSFRFPLLEYPANTVWVSKLFTKLLWFWVLWGIALILSLRSQLRRVIYARPENCLLLLLGLFSLFPLIKTQASHYVFPAATFLSIFISSVLVRSGGLKDPLFAKYRIFSKGLWATAAILVILSVYLYRPDAVDRLFSIRDYSGEERVKQVIQKVVDEHQLALFFKNSGLLYWISGRYPATPNVTWDVQATYWLKQNPDKLLNALMDHDLRMVEFNVSSIGVADQSFEKHNVQILEDFDRELRKRFVISDSKAPPYEFWIRRE